MHHRPSFRSGPLAVAGFLVFLVSASPAAAAVLTWTGAGGSDNWSTPGNWSPAQVPADGDELVFPSGGLQTALDNDLPAGRSFVSLTFGRTYFVTGAPLAITGSLIGDSPVPFAATLDVVIDLASPVVTVSLGTDNALHLSRALSGAGGLRKQGPGTLTLSGVDSNTFAGLTAVHQGTVVLDKASPATAVPAGLEVGEAGFTGLTSVVRLNAPNQIQGDVAISRLSTLSLDGHDDTIGALSMRNGVIATGAGVLTLGGDVTVPDGTATIEGTLSLGGETRTFTVDGNTSPGLRIIATIIDGGGPAGLVKAGPTSIALEGANTYSGVTTVNEGVVVVRHQQALGSTAAGTEVFSGGGVLLQQDVLGEPLTGVNQASGSTNGAIATDCTMPRLWAGPIVLTGLNRVTSQNCLLRLTGPITGTGGLTTRNVIELSGANTYTGGTVVTHEIRLGASNALPDTGQFQVAGTLNLNGFSDTIESVVGLDDDNTITLGGGTLTVAPTQPFEYNGVIAGNGGFVKSGAARVTLSGTSTFPGQTTILQGELAVTGSLPGPVSLQGGTLAGTGSVGAVAGPDGVVLPRIAGGGPGRLSSGSVTFNPDITLALLVQGPTPATEHSQLRVTGTVALNNAAIDVGGVSNVPVIGNTPLVIIDNDGTDAVTGTFLNLPEGATFVADNVRLRVSYVGGTGNDVTLTVASLSYYLSEGATGSFFDTDLLLANPQADPADVELRFLKDDGTTIVVNQTLPALSRRAVRLDEIAGLEATTVSTIVASLTGVPLIVERTMRWDATGYGAHTEKASGGPAATWYFAEGSAGFFHTFLLLANPLDAENVATVTYLPENQPAVTRTYPIAAHARLTVDTKADPDLLHRSFGMQVVFGQPGMAERAMYFGDTPLWVGGHASAGVTEPATSWFLAEGATGPFFETFILLANPGAQDATATVTYLPDTGVPVVKTHTVPAGGRLTLNVEQEDAALDNVAVATQVASTMPIIVERSQYWPFTPEEWLESHNSAGVTALGTRWGLAEGRVGGASQDETYILLANPGTTAANVSVQFLRQDGAPVVKPFVVQPTSRLNVRVGPQTDVPELTDEHFGAVITSDQPIAVERAMYSTGNGQTWTAGTNATATRLP